MIRLRPKCGKPKGLKINHAGEQGQGVPEVSDAWKACQASITMLSLLCGQDKRRHLLSQPPAAVQWTCEGPWQLVPQHPIQMQLFFGSCLEATCVFEQPQLRAMLTDGSLQLISLACSELENEHQVVLRCLRIKTGPRACFKTNCKLQIPANIIAALLILVVF